MYRVDQELIDQLKNEHKPQYVDEAVDRFQEMVQWWNAAKKTFQNPQRSYRGVRPGHRWTLGGYNKMPHALYEVGGIEIHVRTDAPMVTLRRVLKTKVSESQSNTFYVNLNGMMKHSKNRPFTRYNDIIDLLWEDWEQQTE